jgi:hypothetical protein
MEQIEQQLLDLLTKNPWVLLIIGICAILSIPLAIWGIIATIRSNRVRRPSYAVRSNNLVSKLRDRYPDVEIGYRNYGKMVENLTVAKVLILNRGREAIRKGDIVRDHPLKLQMREGCLILSVENLASKSENRFDVVRSADRTSATISFEYLGHYDGGVVQVIHTGTSADDITVEGIIINAGQPIRLRHPRESFLVFLGRVGYWPAALISVATVHFWQTNRFVSLLCLVFVLLYFVLFLSIISENRDKGLPVAVENCAI